MNIYYIRAAIEANTGIALTIDETMAYLVSEDMLNASQIVNAKFGGYACIKDEFSPTKARELIHTLEE